MEDYIGLPWSAAGRDRDGLDCYGLFVLLHRERHGRDLWDPRGYIREMVRHQLPQKLTSLHMRQVERAEEGDAVLFFVQGRPLHVGYALDAQHMLHIEPDVSAVVERFDSIRWRSRLEGIWRCV
ncbi:MAG: NlpC/P60 family protein [Pseudomonadota bacterium]